MIPFFAFHSDEDKPGKKSRQEWDPQVEENALGNLFDGDTRHSTIGA